MTSSSSSSSSSTSPPPAPAGYVTFASAHAPVKAWVRGVPVDDAAVAQLVKTASLPFVFPHVAAMPDVHVGLGATVGSVVPTRGAIVPAAVGVDIGCGMMAVETTLEARHLPDSLAAVRAAIERKVPHGRTNGGRPGDRGAWHHVPPAVAAAWEALAPGFRTLCTKHPRLERGSSVQQLGTLGTGNHFVEVCLDEHDRVWLMLHSGSRGVGNRIGTYFIERAKRELGERLGQLPDRDLAWLTEGTPVFDDYVEAVGWAQAFARENRELMMRASLEALRSAPGIPPFDTGALAVNCHHNYVAEEEHFGARVWVTRKGAVRAGEGELGIVPGSMGARSFVVRGRGNADSLCSCSHGAGRVLSRTQAKQRYTVADQIRATEGIECRKDADVLDEIPLAYKPIEAVMAAQADLVTIVRELRQVVCVKG